MDRQEFLNKYPELFDNGDISKLKITLLKSYSNYHLSNDDTKVKSLLIDYDNMIKSEKRDKLINTLLLETSLGRLRTSILEISPLI